MFKILINDTEYTSFRLFPMEYEVCSQIIMALDIVVLGKLPKENDLEIVWGAVKYQGIKTLPHFDNKTNTTHFQLYLGDR